MFFFKQCSFRVPSMFPPAMQQNEWTSKGASLSYFFCQINICKILDKVSYSSTKYSYFPWGSNHSDLKGGWNDRTKLREKDALKFIDITLRIAPTVVSLKIIKLGS